MIKKVLKAIEDFSLIKKGQNITVALSGGADSIALLSILLQLEKNLGITVHAAHFNHKIRGEEAERDQAFVEAECKRLGVKLFLGSADVPKIAWEKGQSLELAAREERYNFLNSLECDAVATAHTASDNLETIIFNLARGTALKGLCGIPPVRDKFIRPLILCTREEIEEYCEASNISFVTDSTNLCDDYSRNKIRHKIVPVLKELNSSVVETVSKNSISLKQDSDVLEKMAMEEFSIRHNNEGLNIADFSSLPLSIANRVIAVFYQKTLNHAADNFHINAIYEICANGGRTSLPGGMTALTEREFLKIECQGDLLKPKFQYEVCVEEKNIDFFENVHDLLLNNTLDCDKIVGKLVLRNRKEGDKVFLRKANGTKTLKKLYTEHSVPLSERSVLPVLADDEGIVWIYGMDVAKRCAVTKETKRLFCINVIKK